MRDQKPQIRSRFRQAREGIATVERTGYDRAILASLQSLAEVTGAKSVFCYMSSGTEVDTQLLLDWLYSGNKRVLIPKITGNGRMIAVGFDGRERLQTGKFGIPEPVSSTAYTGDIDLCITPGVAFTVNGARLGQGEGYYDRWLAAHPVRCRLALAYECQIADQLPADEHDVPVDIIVTEQRVIRVS